MRVLPANYSPEQELGYTYEKIARQVIYDRFAVPAYHHPDFFAPYDLTAYGVRLEVKGSAGGAKTGDRTRFAFCTRKGNQADWYILICSLPDEWVFYIVPAFEVNGLSSVEISAHPLIYSGKWAKYRERWLPMISDIMKAKNGWQCLSSST